jgi:hypothetical protein
MPDILTPPIEGRCRCGSVRFVCDTAPLWQSHCHCESCRRATGGMFGSYFGLRDGSWRWTGDAPAVYQPGGGVERSFCLICGSPIAFRSPEWPGEMHFFAGTLPEISAYAPNRHSLPEEAATWLKLDTLLR